MEENEQPSCSSQIIQSSNGPIESIFDLPQLVVDKIFSNLTYDDMSKSRGVNQDFNDYVKTEMTKGFEKLGKIIANCKTDVKKELPKRESERRRHRLTRINEIYSALDTRYSLLDLTYKKFMRHSHQIVNICFIPGKVLDEFHRVLDILRRCRESGGEFTGDSTELLKEMRDLSSMAMEHYEEHILPNLESKAESLGIGALSFDAFSIPSIKRRRFGKMCRDNHGLQVMPNFEANAVNNSPAARDFPKTMQDKIDEMQKKIDSQQLEIRALTEGITAMTQYFGQAFPKQRQNLRRFLHRFPIFNGGILQNSPEGTSGCSASTSGTPQKTSRKRKIAEENQEEVSKSL